jgi:hypothetical protein
MAITVTARPRRRPYPPQRVERHRFDQIRRTKMSVAGNYKVTVKTPVGPQEGMLTLRVDGDALSGTLNNPKGSSEFTGGTVNGNEVQFAAKIRTPLGRLKASVAGTVEGDRFVGTAKLPLGVAHIEGVRV